VSSIKKHIFGSYEVEIKISLILLIAFLVSLNFISAYILGKTRLVQQNGYQSKIELAAEIVRKHIEENAYKLPDAGYLNQICTYSGIDRITIADSTGMQLVGVCDIQSSNNSTANDYQQNISIKNGQGLWVYQITVSGSNREGAGLDKLALFDTLFRILGLIAGLIVAILFFKSVMNPYRKIRKEAQELNLPIADINESDSVEYAVRMFQEVIFQLKEKESILQAMYDNSEKRADSLARYNEYILGSISTGVIICDNQGIITRFNGSAQKIMGYEQDVLQGQNFHDVFGKKHQISKILNDALDDRIYSRYEFEMDSKEGERLWIGLSSSLILDNTNNKIGVAVLLTDLTRIKKLQAIADYREKMAALGEMSSGLAHELRNSVAAILGFGKLLKKNNLAEDKIAGIIDCIITESLATEEMLSRLLNFARPLNVVPKTIELSQIIQESLNWTADMRHDRDIEISLSDNSKGILISADPLLLKNALANVIINSYQAMPDGGTLKMELAHYEKDDRIEIRITDSGKGIAPDDLPKIFNPFFTTKEKGTGLGLAMVKKIITAHDGTIEVASKLNEGTTFVISLPRLNMPIREEQILANKNPLQEVSSEILN
jgi:PAS domain S-box-containing protein